MAFKLITVIYCNYCRPTVCAVATVNLPVGIFLSCFMKSKILRLSTGLNYLGLAFLQCRLVSWKRISCDWMEMKKRFFWIHHQLAVLSAPAGYTDRKKKQSCGFINMDRCDSHTPSNHLATVTLPGERIISAFVSCVLSWKSSYSQLHKNALECLNWQAPL